MKRNCEICLDNNGRKLYTQRFLLPGQKIETTYEYDVMTCNKCGFVYASNIMSKEELIVFYKNNLKYAYQSDKGEIPDYAKWLHMKSYKFVDSHIRKLRPEYDKKRFSVLDVGCGAGYLLNYFKQKGYVNLQGLDPAPDCQRVAKELYDIEITTSLLGEYKTKAKYDLVILGSVLEHMSDLGAVIKQITKLLKQGGLLFICVPDGDNMGLILNEPFLEFSLEHINYFTRGSLTNLLSTRGYKKIAFESLLVEKYDGYALNSLWQYDKSAKEIVFDQVGENKINKYIIDSKKKLTKIEKQVENLVQSQEKLYVWGVGSLTSRILSSTKLKECNIIAYVDSNLSLQGRVIAGKSIIAPTELEGKNTTVFIASYIHSTTIRNDLLSKYHHKGSIITLK